MEWLLIYLFVMVERIGSMLMFSWLFFWIGLGCFLAAMAIAGCMTESSREDFGHYWKAAPSVKLFKRISFLLIPFGMFFGTMGYLTPGQKDLAIIVGSGVTYNVLTSDTGKRLGGKAIELLEQKIESALASPGAVVAPKPKGESL